MRRRRFVATSGVLLTGITAGCGALDGDTGEQGDGDAGDSEGTDGPAAFTDAEIAAPSDVAVDESVPLTVSVTNEGGATGTSGTRSP